MMEGDEKYTTNFGGRNSCEQVRRLEGGNV
jgi:hypothetical protein